MDGGRGLETSAAAAAAAAARMGGGRKLEMAGQGNIVVMEM